MTDPLDHAQRQRLAVLEATRAALLVEIADSFDLIRCADWVATGRDPDHHVTDPDVAPPDEMMWTPPLNPDFAGNRP